MRITTKNTPVFSQVESRQAPRFREKKNTSEPSAVLCPVKVQLFAELDTRQKICVAGLEPERE